MPQAHTTDGWKLGDIISTRRQHQTLSERAEAANEFSIKENNVGETIPIYLDQMDNAFNTAYSVWPERVVVVGDEDRLEYLQDDDKSTGNNPIDAERWLIQAFPEHPRLYHF